MAIIAIANQKGGVGKTTIALALSTALADIVGKNVLLLDLDAQANATAGLGQFPSPGIANWLMMGEPLKKVVVRINDHLDLIPSNGLTEDTNLSLASRSNFEAIKKGLEGTAYDYVIVDCPPSVSMITRVGIFASDFVLTPIDCERFALQGLGPLSTIIKNAQEKGSRVRWLGVVPNKYRDVKVHQQNVEVLKRMLGRALVWEELPLTTQIAKAQEAEQTIWECPLVDRNHQAVWARMVQKVLEYA